MQVLYYLLVLLVHYLLLVSFVHFCSILGLSICYRLQGKYEEALKEVYNLNIFLQVLNSTDLRIASANSNARILMDLRKYEQALDVLWIAYEEIKHTKHIKEQHQQ